MTQTKNHNVTSAEDIDLFDVTQMADAAFESFTEVLYSTDICMLHSVKAKFYILIPAGKLGCNSNTQHRY